MKILCIILLLTNISIALIGMDDNGGITISNPINSEKLYGDGRRSLLQSRSPDDFISLLGSRSKDAEELQKEIEVGRKNFQENMLVKRIIDFVNNEACLVIKEYKIVENCTSGDPKIDQKLSLLLHELKKKDINLEKSNVELQSGEDLINYKIRSNPHLCNKIDQQIISLALLLNELIRFSNSK